MKNIIKKKYYILSFIIPMIICLIFLVIKKVIPNIETFFASDIRIQHLPILNYMKNILLGKSSPYYSYNAGMGNSMLSTLVFYTISPINILLVIIKDIRYAILCIYILKICLSGLTMFIFLKNKFKKEKFITVIFSTCYALSSYVINYFFCIFWFDSVYLAPLVLLGIDKIIDKEKINLLYIFSLSLAIMCNIQMGFGLCIFSVIYYIYSLNIRYNIKKEFKKIKKLSLIFIISSICAGAIASGFILAFLSNYNDTSIARSIGVKDYSQTSSIDSIIKNLFSIGWIKKDYYNEFEPLLYCGLIVPLLFSLYLFDKNIDKKKRKSTLIVLLLFIINFCTKSLNILWHLSVPILLNYRYSIYLSLFLTLISYEYYINKDKLNKKDIIILTSTIFLALLFDIIYRKEIHFIHTIVFLVLIGILLFLVKNISRKFELILILTIITEVTLNSYLSLYTSDDFPFGRYSSYDSFLKLYNLNNHDQSYRVSYDYSYGENDNDGFLLNKNSSLRYFYSVINGNAVKFTYRNYSSVGKNYYLISSYDSPLLLSILGNKYFYLQDDVDSGLYKKIDTYKIKSYDYMKKKVKDKSVYLYENPYALSLGYVIEKDYKYNKKNNFIDYQNNIIKSFSGENKDVIKKLDYGKIENNSYCNKESNYICRAYYVNNNTNNNYVYLYSEAENVNTNYNIDIYKLYYDPPFLLKTKEKYFEVSCNFLSDLYLDKVYFITYDKESLIKHTSVLKENMLTNIKTNKNIMKAQINSSKNGILFLSIPYDKNFKIYVDGKKIKYYPLLDNTFIGLDIKKGKHNIILVNIDNNLKWYIISSVISLIITLIIFKNQRKFTKS